MLIPFKSVSELETELIASPVALFVGLMFALIIGTPCTKFNKKLSKYLFQVSVVGLGLIWSGVYIKCNSFLYSLQLDNSVKIG